MSESVPWRADQLASMLDAVTDRVACYRRSDHVIVYCNRAWAAGHGAVPEEMLGRNLDTLLTPAELLGLRSQLARLGPEQPGVTDGDFRPAPEDPQRWVQWIDKWLASPEGDLVVAIGRDVTELRNAYEELAAVAIRDPLTGLANRRLLTELSSIALARAPRSGRDVAVLFVDVDDLKVVNDTYGHDAGDRLLCAVADRLTRTFRDADVVARIGGDEFVVVLETATVEEETLRDRVHVAVSAPLELADGAVLRPSVSLGLARSETSGWDMERLLRDADSAMYERKRVRTSVVLPRR